MAPVTIEMPVDAFIPDDYINDRTLKMSFYQRLANFTLPEQVEAIAAEMATALARPLRRWPICSRSCASRRRRGMLGFEYVGMRDSEIVLKLKRTVAPDRVALYKRFRKAPRCIWARFAFRAGNSRQIPA